MRDRGPSTKKALLATQSCLDQDASSSRPSCEPWFLPFLPTKQMCCWPLSAVNDHLPLRSQRASSPLCSHEYHQPSAKRSVSPKGWKMVLESQEMERRGGQGDLGSSAANPRIHAQFSWFMLHALQTTVPCKVMQPTAGHEGTIATYTQAQGFSGNCPPQFGKVKSWVT